MGCKYHVFTEILPVKLFALFWFTATFWSHLLESLTKLVEIWTKIRKY